MLLNFARFVGISIAGMALANSAWAQDANVTTGANSMKLGGEFRSEFNYTNNGLEKTDGYTPKSSSTIELQTVKVTLKGKYNATTEYAVRFDLLDGGNYHSTATDYAYGTHWLSDVIGFSIGQMKTLEGGWDIYTNNYRTHAVSVYKDQLPVDLYQPMFAFHVKAAGQITLQLFNDTTDGATNAARWNKTAHPTFALGWMGKFGPIEPLVNIGTYDNQKSHWVDVGVRTNMSGLTASIDYNQNTISNKIADGTDFKSKEDVGSNLAIRAGYEIKGAAMPWLYYANYDLKENADANTAGKDVKVNTTQDPDPVTGVTSYDFDDNGQVFGIGADLMMMGEGWNPYVALVNRSGKWMDGTSEKTRSEMQVRIGVLGEI